jgi:hypothetical protein
MPVPMTGMALPGGQMEDLLDHVFILNTNEKLFLSIFSAGVRCKGIKMNLVLAIYNTLRKICMQAREKCLQKYDFLRKSSR